MPVGGLRSSLSILCGHAVVGGFAECLAAMQALQDGNWQAWGRSFQALLDDSDTSREKPAASLVEFEIPATALGGADCITAASVGMRCGLLMRQRL